jgi:Ca2+-binding RTX toxin-like protein
VRKAAALRQRLADFPLSSAGRLALPDTTLHNDPPGDDVIYGTDLAANFMRQISHTSSELIFAAPGPDWAGIEGTPDDDNLFGTPFGDSINGQGGNDTIHAGGGNDYIDGSAGNDTLFGEGGNDYMIGGTGDDTLDGGDGDQDSVNYTLATAGVTVSLSVSTPQSTGGAGIDTVLNVEHLTGSEFDDTLTGDAANNHINGIGGNDTISGLAGNDYLDAGSGNNTVLGGAGNDYMVGGPDNDTFDGGDGDNDSINYNLAAAGVTFSLSIATPQNTGGAGIDTVLNVEDLTGSDFNDTLTGSAANNHINGMDSNDTISGLGGNDYLDAGSGNDTLFGGADGDWMLGGTDDDTLDGGAGDDHIDGGDGEDTASYATSTAAVTVDLSRADGQNTLGAGSDTLISMENLTGSAFGDTLKGNDGANRIDGGDGNDAIFGGLGRDVLLGGKGADKFDFRTVAFSPGQLIKIDGGENPIAEFDLLKLPGKPNDYKIETQIGLPGAPTHTIFTHLNTGAQFDTVGLERVTFVQPFDNQVSATNTVQEMARLTLDAYDDHKPGRNWHGLSAIELGMIPYSPAGSTLQFSMIEGWYSAIEDTLGPESRADAIVSVGILDGVRVLSISFRGSNEAGDFKEDGYAIFSSFQSHYDKFKPLLEAIDLYITDSANQISKVLVSGHSLGAAIMQMFLKNHPDPIRFQGVGLATPGVTGVTGPDVHNIINFAHSDDPVASVGSKQYNGIVVTINTPAFNSSTKFEHSANLYYADFIDILSHASNSSSPFSSSPLGIALANGLIYSGSNVQISLSDNNDVSNTSIESFSGDNFVLGSDANNTILWNDLDQFFDKRIIDGGGGFDTLKLSGFKSQWTWPTASDQHQVTYNGTSVGEIWNIEKLVFLYNQSAIVPSGESSTEQPSLAPGDLVPVVYLDGSSAVAQSAGPGDALLNVDPNADYVLTGTGSLTVNGSADDDIIMLGGGIQTIFGGSGDDIVNARGATKTGTFTITGGAGSDTILGIAGAQSIAVFSGSIGDYLAEQMADDTIRLRDNRMGSPDGTDSLVDVQALRFADGDISITDYIAAFVPLSLYGSGESDELVAQPIRAAAIYGFAGDDTLSGSVFTDILLGGAGDDLLKGFAGADQIDGGTGTDTADYTSSASGVSVNLLTGTGTSGDAAGDSYVSIENVRGSALGDTLIGNDLANVITGNGGNDSLTGNGGIDMLSGGEGNDRIAVTISGGGSFVDGGAGTDTLAVSGTVGLGGLIGIEAVELAAGSSLTLTGQQVKDGLALTNAFTGTGLLTINMTAGQLLATKLMSFGVGVSITINGTAASDIMKLGNAVQTVNGGDGTDQIKGGSLVDTINGGGGIDKIMGLGGADILTGGAGNDVFRLLAQSDSTTGAGADRITDFTIGEDRINFSKIDTNPGLAGDQGFAFAGTAAFAGGGLAQVRYLTSGSDLIVQADVNGDGAADMEVILQGMAGQSLTSAQFVLGTPPAMEPPSAKGIGSGVDVLPPLSTLDKAAPTAGATVLSPLTADSFHAEAAMIEAFISSWKFDYHTTVGMI